MSKDIKDYLHLYLGCEVTARFSTGKLISVGTDLEPTIVRIKNDDEESGFYGEDEDFEFEEKFKGHIKPILRPLSDLTHPEHSEAKYIAPLERDAWKRDAERTRYLLSKGFDLFGLIEAGLAIDKTKL